MVKGNFGLWIFIGQKWWFEWKWQWLYLCVEMGWSLDGDNWQNEKIQLRLLEVIIKKIKNLI